MKKNIGAIVAVLALIVGVGCGSGSSGGGGGGTIFTPEIDLVVGDNNTDYASVSAFPAASILLYFDVLNDSLGGLQDPDVILDDVGSGVAHPRFLALSTDEDLYVSDRDSTDVEIWRGYRSLADGDAPDVLLTDDGGGAGSISDPRTISIKDDILIVPDESNAEVYLWGNASAITVNDTVPDVVLATDETNSEGHFHSTESDTLWVANWSTTGTDGCVTRYDGVEAIVTGGTDPGADNVLTVNGSFLGVGNCRRVWVDDNSDTLFVLTQDSGTGDDDALWVFADATTFADDALPVAVIAHTGTQMLNPLSATVLNNRLYVGSRNNGDEDECKDLPGIVAYDLDSTGSLVSTDLPSVDLGGTVSGMSGNQELRAVGGFLFANNLPGCDDHAGFGDIKIFAGALGGPVTGDSPFMVLPALKDFTAPISLDAILVDSGT